MNKLLAGGDRDGVVEALFQSVQEISDEGMAALRSAPTIGNLIEPFNRLLCDIGSTSRSCVSIGPNDSFAQTDFTNRSTEGAEMNATTVTDSLGKPFFVEQGRVIGQRVLAVTPQPQLESSFMANATITNGSNTVSNATNTGTSVSTLNADGTFRGEGQGILRTQGGDLATWTNQVVGNLTAEGTIITRGVGFWSTPSTTGELAFMDGMITVFEVQIDAEGNLSAREWEWR